MIDLMFSFFKNKHILPQTALQFVATTLQLSHDLSNRMVFHFLNDVRLFLRLKPKLRLYHILLTLQQKGLYHNLVIVS